jgi:hypothetical protein
MTKQAELKFKELETKQNEALSNPGNSGNMTNTAENWEMELSSKKAKYSSNQ